MAEEAPSPDMPNMTKLDLTDAAPGTRPKFSSEKRASSAPKERPPPPLTPRARKASRSLFRELEGTCMTMRHAHKRTQQTYNIVVGTIKELQNSALSSRTTLENNKKMVAGTKQTKPGELGSPPKPKSPGEPSSKALRPVTMDEREEVKRELRLTIEEAGEERDATDEEVDAEIASRREAQRMEKEKLRVKTGAANKGIVDCLEKLVESSLRSVNELHSHERTLENMIMSLQEIIDNLTEHKDMRDSLFDPLLSTDLPYAKKKGFKPIQRSVLYQKMNFVPKNKDGSDMKPDWDDKDQEAVAGKRGSIPDDKGRIGLTGHQATFCAAEREDTARAQCNAALKAVRMAQSTLASKKSALQVAVLHSREQAQKAKRAAKTGNFGSSEARNTDPATRKTAANPEDAGG